MSVDPVVQRVRDTLLGLVRLRISWGKTSYDVLVSEQEYDSLWSPQSFPEKGGWKVERL